MATATHTWQFVLTDVSGSVLGEILNASNRQLVLPLNRVPTAGFQIPMNHRLSSYCTDIGNDYLIKVYRDGVLLFCGPIVSHNEVTDPAIGPSVSVNAAGALWKLGYRLLGQGAGGWSYGTASAPYDLGYIAQQMLAAGNTDYATGIVNGTQVNSSSGAAGVYYFKDILSAIAELSAGANSFDFEAAPLEPSGGGATPSIAQLNTIPLIGTSKPQLIFEYGTTRANVASYGRQGDRSQLATKGFIQQPASTDNTGILTSTDSTREALRGRYEALVDNGGVEWDVLRQALVNQAVAIRAFPRQIITFTPAVNTLPTFGGANGYIVGDQVRARIINYGLLELDAMMRIWGVTFNLDANTNESITLELIAP